MEITISMSRRYIQHDHFISHYWLLWGFLVSKTLLKMIQSNAVSYHTQLRIKTFFSAFLLWFHSLKLIQFFQLFSDQIIFKTLKNSLFVCFVFLPCFVHCNIVHLWSFFSVSCSIVLHFHVMQQFAIIRKIWCCSHWTPNWKLDFHMMINALVLNRFFCHVIDILFHIHIFIINIHINSYVKFHRPKMFTQFHNYNNNLSFIKDSNGTTKDRNW